YGPQNDVTLKMPAFEWVHVQLHQQKGMISLSPPTICNSALLPLRITPSVAEQEGQQTETEATGAPQKHHYTLNQQVGSITSRR
ncbi:hypothetical protein, partial [Klebsiella pneumoniae]|uniref:hypothetical protein n=2 Tax=Klebsiella pneumoniae TaxID=573 RepID=UPI002741DCFB